MTKRILSLAALILITLMYAACGQDQPTQPPPSEVAVGERPPLPAPLAVIASARLEHKPGMGNLFDFGKAIALQGGVLAVGAPDRTSGFDPQNGTVFIYRRQGGQWQEESQLFASDKDDGFQYQQHFGASLSFSGDLLFVGAPDADDPQYGDNSGAVYVFQDSPEGWQETARLTPAEPVAGAGFGAQLATFGESLAVNQGSEEKYVYIFQRNGSQWEQQASLELPGLDGAKGRIRLIALYGDSLVVSGIYFEGQGEQAQVENHLLYYERSGEGWQGPVELSSEIGMVGGPVALDGDGQRATRMAVLDSESYQSAFGSGSVVIFDRSPTGWEPGAVLTAPDGALMDSFGASLALQGNYLLVGAPGASEDSFWDGTAYLFEYYQGRWVDQLRITHPEDGGSGDFFGGPAVMHGKTILLGAADEFGGAAYVFEIGERQ